MPRSYRFLLTLLATLLASGAAWADEPEAKKSTKKPDFGEVAIVDAEPPSASLPKKRAVPDYSGRGKDPAATSDVLLWIPRILIAPLYFAANYLVRRPIGAIIVAIERDKLTQRALHITSGGHRDNLGLSPTFYWESSFYPSIGAYFWWDDVGSPKNHVRAQVATWGRPVVTATVADRFDIGAHSNASLRASFNHRDDNVFYGLGPDSKEKNKSRYGVTSFEGGPTFDVSLRRGLDLATRAGIRGASYRETEEEASLYGRVRRGTLPPPPRLFDDGFTSVFDAATLSFDTRERGHFRETGAYASIGGAPSFDVSRHPGASWARYEAHAAGFYDLTRTQRVLSIRGDALFVDPIQGGASGIPFTEHIALGGLGPMRGFYPGRLVGRSAAVVTLGYEWPIWTFLDGTIEAATGNVFGAGLDGFALEKLRLSTAFGVRSTSSPDHQLELLVGFGTDTFGEGASLTAFRIALGATHGF